MNKIELLKTDNNKFRLKLTLDAGEAGQVEFISIYPNLMSVFEAEARLFRLCEMYGYKREHLPYKNASTISGIKRKMEKIHDSS